MIFSMVKQVVRSIPQPIIQTSQSSVPDGFSLLTDVNDDPIITAQNDEIIVHTP